MRANAGELRTRLAALEPDDPRHNPGAAVALVLSFAAGGPEVLLMRRAERAGDRWSGQVGLPGGHRESDDEDLVATAVRETREEVGVDLGREARLLGAMPSIQARARGDLLALRICPVVFEAREPLHPIPGDEAQEVFWLPLLSAANGTLAATHAPSPEGRPFPCWRFEGHVIWGLTYEMLRRLIRLGR